MSQQSGKTIRALEASVCSVHHIPMARTVSHNLKGPHYEFLSCPACNTEALDRMAKQPGVISITVGGGMGLGDALTQDQEDRERERREWAGDYDGTTCPNCSRLRMLKCANGKRRCEKCNWDPEAGTYSEGPYIG